MISLRLPVAFAALTLISIGSLAMASAPSPDDLSRWADYVKEHEARIARAEPWMAALKKAMPSEPDSTLEFLFLTTYKHHVPDSTHPAEEADPAALGLSKAWKKAKEACLKSGLEPVELAEAVYRFTNSDWAPVSTTRGPGLDKVATAKDFEPWIAAVIAAGKKAKEAGLAPVDVWTRQAASYEVKKPSDLAKVGLNPAPPRH